MSRALRRCAMERWAHGGDWAHGPLPLGRPLWSTSLAGAAMVAAQTEALMAFWARALPRASLLRLSLDGELVGAPRESARRLLDHCRLPRAEQRGTKTAAAAAAGRTAAPGGAPLPATSPVSLFEDALREAATTAALADRLVDLYHPAAGGDMGGRREAA